MEGYTKVYADPAICVSKLAYANKTEENAQVTEGNLVNRRGSSAGVAGQNQMRQEGVNPRFASFH